MSKHHHKHVSRLKNWRKKVLKRDNYTCQNCERKTYLSAQHKVPISESPELAYEVSNGITLCIKCHAKEDGNTPTAGIFGVSRKGKNTKVIFIDQK